MIIERSTRKFCDTTCRVAALRLKKAPAKLDKLSESSFFQWVIAQCQRAGTVQILQGADLTSLLQIFTYSKKVGGYDNGKPLGTYSICHISPVAGSGTIGLLHERNLFIGSKVRNQKHYTTNYGAGLSIRETELLSKWRIDHTEGRPKIREKILSFIGNKALLQFMADNTFNKSTRFKYIDELSSLETAKGEEIYDTDHLNSLTTDSLIALAKQHDIKVNSFTRGPDSELGVMAKEVSRAMTFGHPHGNETSKKLQFALEQAWAPHSYRWRATPHQSEVLASAAFDYLSGNKLSAEATTVIDECHQAAFFAGNEDGTRF